MLGNNGFHLHFGQREVTMDDRLDELCAVTANPEVLNALYACRHGHPLGWQHAYALVWQHIDEFLDADLDWLETRAAAELGVAPEIAK
jgi:hypothetical protein